MGEGTESSFVTLSGSETFRAQVFDPKRIVDERIVDERIVDERFVDERIGNEVFCLRLHPVYEIYISLKIFEFCFRSVHFNTMRKEILIP